MSLRISVTPKQFLEQVDQSGQTSGGLGNAGKKETAGISDEERKKAKKELEERLNDLNVKADEAYKLGEEKNSANNFKQMEYDTRSDDELKNAAAAGLNEKYDLKADALIEENEQKDKSLREKKDEIALNAEKLNKKTEDLYDSAKENANGDAIKRGIARSSIIAELLKEYDKEKLAAIENRNAETQKQISEIDDEIAGLSGELNASLKKFDMEKAIEVNEKLEKLKAEREKRNAETIKYNNQVKQDMIKYADSLKQSAAENNYTRQGDDYKQQIAFAIIDYYSKFKKQDAINDFEKSGYESLLNETGKKMVKNYLKTMPNQ